jgi:hypothetical protein
MTLPQLWAALSVALPIVAALAAANLTRDFGYQIRVGEIFLRTGTIVRHDPFTFTARGLPWLNQQWGAHVLFALLYRAGGWTAFALARAAVVGLTFTFVYLASRAAGANRRWAAWLTLLSFVVASQQLGLRPQLLAALLFAAALWLVAGRREHPGRLYAIPAMVAVWANIHGSFFLAPLLIAIAVLEDRRDRVERGRLLKVGVLSMAAAVLNPFGLRVWSYVVDLSTNHLVTRFVAEWQPPTIRETDGVLFFASALALVGVMAMRSRPTSWPTLAGVAAFFAVALFASRGILWWALAVPPLMARELRSSGETERDDARERPAIVNTLILVIVVGLGVSVLPWWRDRSPVASSPGLTSDAPLGETSAMRGLLRPGDRIFNAETWGSWFELQFPRNPTFVDSRIEVFPAPVWSDYIAVSAGLQGWQAVLDRWRISVIAADRGEQAGLLSVIRRDPGWRLVHSDRRGFVFVRTDVSTSR